MEKRTRKIQPITPIEAQVQETIAEPVVVKPKWKVVSGGVTLLDRVYHSIGDVFEAEAWEISPAIKDLVKCLNPETLQPKPKPIVPKYFLQEAVPTAEEADEEDYIQLYNIINARDKVISEKPLPKEQADELLKKLNV